jgi:plastocyanin
MWRRLIVWAIKAAVVLILATAAGLGLLAYADYDMAGNGSPDPHARVAWVWERGDHLHYAVHIIQARVFDLCPCTRRAAATQYFEAHFHALTPHQRDLIAAAAPRTRSQWAEYVVGPFVVVGDWVHDSVTWVAGQRPSQEATVVMDDYAFQAQEIVITRGTRVTWRNVDDQGEPHTVISEGNLFQSDFIVPDESFSYTFTERGRYPYYCSVHGGPGEAGMSGIVIVQ